MGSYLLVLVIAAVAAAVYTPVLMSVGARVGALDNTADPPMPRVGGWVLALGCATALLLVGVAFTPTGGTLLGKSELIRPVLLGSGAILILGTIDDISPISARVKFAAQAAIALGTYLLGVRIHLVSFPLGGLELGGFTGGAFTVIWLVGIANAFNLLDGADGVATGSAFLSATAIFIMSVMLGHPAIGLVAAALAGSLLGFLPFNFPPARAYLGDSGSLLTGFLLAGLAVGGSTKGPTLLVIAVPVLAFGVPVFDTTITLFRRLVRGQSLFARDREHVHHQLLRAGLSARQVLGVIYLASVAFAAAAMLFLNPGARSYAVALIVIGGGIGIMARFLRLHELNELARLARRGAIQPKAIAVNVQLRRAVEHLTAAQSLEDLMQGLEILLERSEFDDVLLIVAKASERRGNARTWWLSDGKFIAGRPERHPDEWEVVCPFEGAGWVGELHLRRRLGKKSLLLDLNLLLELVQPALAGSATRIDVNTIFPS
ncbi:MAG: MraY family glycosyltransferase [Gemmatimonadales bacterium]